MTIDIVEEERHDVIVINADGSSYLNGVEIGNPARKDMFSEEKNGAIAPLVAFNYAYSYTPFKGTYASEYNIGPTTHNNKNVYVGKLIRLATGYAIGWAIATYLFPVSKEFAAERCAEIGLSLQTKAEEMADDSNALSYKVTSYGRSGNDTFKFYKKFAGSFYTRTNYAGSSIYKTLYELRTTLS